MYITVLDNEMSTAVNHIHSFGYLVKPVNKMELYYILFDALDLIEQKLEEDTITFLSEDHIPIKLKIKDIYYFEYFSRKIKVVTKDKTYICINEKISNIADRLEKYSFVMSHQSFVVNLNYVNRISSGLLIMENDDKVDLAQKRASAFRKKLNTKLEQEQNARQMKMDAAYSFNQADNQEEMLAVIHDIKKHLAVLEKMKQGGAPFSELKRYADSVKNLMTPLLLVHYCNNAVLNIILNDKVQYCKKNGIQFDVGVLEIDIEYLEPVSVTAIFGNILDNAITACEKAKEKKIGLEAYHVNGYIYICLSNTYAGEIRQGADGKLVSTKGKGHGIGLKNVEKALKDYSGQMTFSTDGNMFTIEIMIGRPE